MSARSFPQAENVATDGSPYPDRRRPSFEHDVRAMFTYIARRYDWFDHLASLGQDYLWRPRAVWTLERFRGGRSPHRILDVGCGTGDLSMIAARHFPGCEVVGVDFTQAMVERSARRSDVRALGGRAGFLRASALHLPFGDGRFDVVMSAFVARNLSDLPAAFREFLRVLAPGGTLLTLEITEPTSARFRSVFHAYFDRVVPWLGAAVKSAGPYRYLPESLRHLPDRRAMLDLLRRTGFAMVDAFPQSMGIVTAYLAARAPAAGQTA